MKKQGMNTKLLSHILILSLVMIIAVTATFSWYNRTPSTGTETGNVLKYSQSGNVNGEGGTIKTYAGTNNNGKVTYSDTELSVSSQVPKSAPGTVNYFKTVITSTTDSNVSVYLEDLSYDSALNGNVKIGIIQPEKTYKSFSVLQDLQDGGLYKASRICLEDNLTVRSVGTTEIYWFVEVDPTTEERGNITLGTMHLVYN